VATRDTNYAGTGAALNADGSRMALALGSGTTVYDRNLAVQMTGLPTGPAAFNPVTGTLYIISNDYDKVSVYDSATYAFKKAYSVGERVALDASRDGIMTVSADGGTLYVTTAAGVRIVPLEEGAPAGIGLTTPATTSFYGDTVTLTASIGTITGGGYVRFLQGDTPVSTVTLTGHQAQFGAGVLETGEYEFSAVVVDSYGRAAPASRVHVTVVPQVTTTTLTASQTLVLPDEPATLTVTVHGALIPTGTVTFYDGETALGTFPLNASGQASYEFATSVRGTYSLSAHYNGATHFAASTSSAVSEIVRQDVAKLAFVDPITTVPATGTFTLRVALWDKLNKVVQDATATLNLSIGSAIGGGTLSGPTRVAVVDGVATFSGLSISRAGTYGLYVSNGSGLVTNLPGLVVTPPATHLAFVSSGTSGPVVAGQVMAPVTVQLLNAKNRVVPMNGPVTIALTKANGAAVAGTLTVQAQDGVAAFDDLSMTKAGKYTWSATFGTMRTAVSKAFTVVADESTSHLVLLTQPTNLALDKAVAKLTVNVQDRFGNVVTTYNNVLNLGIASGPEGAALKGRVAVMAKKGVATFSGIVPTLAGDYTLTVTGGALAPVTTNGLNVYYVPKGLVATVTTGTVAAPLTLPPVTVRVVDAKKRTVTTSAATVTVALVSPKGAVLHGTLSMSAVNGVVSFSDLSVDVPGTYTLKLTTAGLTATSLKVVVKG
jgi:hypothetical protein